MQNKNRFYIHILSNISHRKGKVKLFHMDENLSYTRLTEDEKNRRHILGILSGPCADIENPTRNGRLYGEEVWEHVFEDPIVKEQFEAGGIFGELCHPADRKEDRDEVDLERIAVCMPSPPTRNKDGLLIGQWHILDTPCGRILKTLADYGYKMGVSSRGCGDIEQDYQGNEIVVPKSYQLNAFDIVLVPAVKAARVRMVESLNNKSLNESLNDMINGAEDNAKVIMQRTLEDLKIKITSDDLDKDVNVDIPDEVKSETDIKVSTSDENDDAKNEDEAYSEDNIEADKDENTVDDVEESLINDLQEALNEKQSYKLKVDALQNSLSVGYAKELSLTEENNKLKQTIERLVEDTKNLNGMQVRANKFENDSRKFESLNKALEASSKIDKLANERMTEALKRSNETSTHLTKSLNEAKATISNDKLLIENLQKQNDKLSLNVRTLQENIQQMDIKLQGQTNLNLKARDRIAELKNNNQQLNEQLSQQEEGLDQIETYRNKLAESIKECSSYKKRAQELQEAYAQVVSKQYGVDFNEIQDKLSDTKSAEEIRNLCESIQSKNLRMKSLPFEQGKSIQKITYNNSKPLSESKKVLTDSDVDADLERLFEIYNHR